MKQNELMLNRLTEGQSVPRPHFGDAAIVFDSDGVFKYVDGNDGEMRLIYPQMDDLALFPEATFRYSSSPNTSSFTALVSHGSILDFTTTGPYLNSFALSNGGGLGSPILPISKINGASQLVNIKNVGTGNAVTITFCSLSASEINKFFTELPPTTETATLNLQNNPGSATCTPSIATDKGYTVVV